MKNTSTFRTPFLLAVVAVSFILLNSCSQKLRFVASPVVPAAEGKVKVKRDNNRNYAISINIRHLAEPEKLVPPQRNYVVWLETEQRTIKNLGQLKSSSGFLSKTLKASMNTVTSFKPQRVFITAESDPGITYPYGPMVLTTPDFR